MSSLYKVIILGITLVLSSNFQPVSAQSTWQEVYTILSTNCSGSNCHSNNSNGFDVTASSADLYTALVDVSPSNATALGKGDKFIDPGYPARSFALRTVGNCMSSDLALSASEVPSAHDGLAALQDQEIELIRQWILYGAPETGTVVDKSIIDDYYINGGIAKIEQPTPPKSCEGFQVHMGPLFFEPGEESEWFQKYDLKVADSLEVTGLEVFFNDESHHFILRKFVPGTEGNWPQGLTPLDPFTAFDSDKDYVMAWQDNEDVRLPNGTAYFWAPNSSLDLNFHMFNYHNEILPGEVYLNIYTQPKGTALKEMKSKLINSTKIGISIGGIPGGNIINNSQDQLFSDKDGTKNVSIWTLTSHTHKYGVDYNIFFQNQNGSKGAQIFDGTYNYRQGFDTGSYDWEHPPTAVYEPFLNMNDTINNGTKPNGLLHETTYNNDGPNTVGFGFTTADEMMIFYMQYVEGTFSIPSAPVWTSTCQTETYTDPCLKTGIVDFTNDKGIGMSLYPNPTNGIVNISYQLEGNANNVSLEVVNMLGEIVNVLVKGETQQVGSHEYQYNANANGVYFIRLSVDGAVSTQKLVFTGN